MRERTNDQWLADLRGPDPDEALGDLYGLLVRGLKAGLRTSGGGVDASAGAHPEVTTPQARLRPCLTVPTEASPSLSAVDGAPRALADPEAIREGTSEGHVAAAVRVALEGQARVAAAAEAKAATQVPVAAPAEGVAAVVRDLARRCRL